MFIEQLIFMFVSFAIFIYMFFRMIKNNDTTYVVLLVIEALGIALNFAGILSRTEQNMILLILKYIFAVLLPILIIALEKRGFYLSEIININLAKLYFMLGNNKKAKQALLNLLNRNPNSYKAHKMLAEIYEQEGGLRRAIDEYVLAVDINKKDYNSYYKVANLLNTLDKKEEASQMLFTLLSKNPQMEEASMLLGEILIETENYKEAVNVYQEALKYNPGSFDINYNLGIAYTMLNDFQSAKRYYEMAAEINSLAYNTRYSLAEIALIYKELEEAEKRFLEAIEEDELAADSYYELSKISLIKKDKDKAIKYINIAIDIDSSKIVPKVKKDPIFIPIMAKISIPFNLEEREDKENDKLTKKEKKCKEHLEEMVDITRTLSYQDINLLKKNVEERPKYKEKEEEEIEQKERQD